jgi:hypothetical protein
MNADAGGTRAVSNRDARAVVLWSVLVVLLCAAGAVIALPFPPPSWPLRAPRESERVLVASGRLYAVRAEMQYAAMRYRALSAQARWREAAARSASAVVFDATIPAVGRAVLEPAAQRQWSLVTADGAADAARARLFVTLDSGGIDIASATRPLRGGESQYFALPADDGPCIAMIRLRQISEPAARAITLGPCAFYARFGTPGNGVRTWLESTGGAPAMRLDAETARSLESRLLSVTALELSAGACLVHGGEHCLVALGLRDQSRGLSGGFPRPPGEPLPGLIGSGPRLRNVQFGERSSWLLSDMAREIGDERFRVFWRSPDAPEVAFQKATGTSIEEWTRRWLGRGVEPVVSQAGMQVPNVAWVVVALPLLLAVAVRSRERVFSA